MIAAEETRFEDTYQPRPVQTVSTSGAHRNFHVCGSVLVATIPAITVSDRPALPASEPIVTMMKPLVAPNGRNSKK